MRTPLALGRGLAALALVLATAVLVAPGAGARAGAQPDCDIADPLPSGSPGPIARDVEIYDGRQDAVPAVHAILDEVLDRVAPANRARLAGKVVTVHVVPKEWDLTMIPRWEDREGVAIPGDPYGRTYDELRGAARSGNVSLDIAVGEETLVTLPGGNGYPSPAEDSLGQMLVHEIGHVVENGLVENGPFGSGLPDDQRFVLLVLQAKARVDFLAGRMDDIIGIPDVEEGGEELSFNYTTRNEDEFFAVATDAWFQRNGGERFRRAWVQEHNPCLFRLLDQVYDVPPPPKFCQGLRATKVLNGSENKVSGMPGPDVIVGSSARDVVFGNEGDDVVCGGGGNDAVDGGPGSDSLRGEAGPDSMTGGPGDDTLVGGPGDDLLLGEAGDDYVQDDVTGNPQQPSEPGDGDDRMDGGPGDDTVLGGTGDDDLIAGTGRDQLYGDKGADTLGAVDPNGPLADLLDGGADFDVCRADPQDDLRSCALMPPGPPTVPAPTPPPENAPAPGSPSTTTTTTTAPPPSSPVPAPPGEPPRHEP